jgi:hypothetical protein
MEKLSEETAPTELRDMALSCYARLQPILADAPETCEHYPSFHLHEQGFPLMDFALTWQTCEHALVLEWW